MVKKIVGIRGKACVAKSRYGMKDREPESLCFFKILRIEGQIDQDNPDTLRQQHKEDDLAQGMP